MTRKVKLPLFTRSSDTRGLSECQMRWFLEKAYADSIPDAGYFHLGTAIHLGIEKAITDDLDLAAATKVASDCYLQLSYDSEQEGKELRWGKRRNADTALDDITRMVGKWFTSVHPDAPKRIARYSEFRWPPETEVRIDWTPSGHFPVRTTMDALFTHPNGWKAIVDWKSGATAKAKDKQLWFYRWAAEGAGILPEGQPHELWFHHVDFNKIQEAEPYPGDAVVEHWLTVTEARKEAEVWEPNPDWWCNYCRAATLCPVWNGGSYEPVDAIEVEWVREPSGFYDQEDEG